MTTAAQMRDRYALVTGGSTGIGAAISDALADHGANLVLVSRDGERLDSAAADIRRRHGVQVLTIAADLAAAGEASRLLDEVARAGIEVELLVNSAGASSRGLVADTDPARLRRLVDLNVGALTELSAALAAQMVERGRGSIVNIASTGGYGPAPMLAAYAASKAFVLSFTQALWAETRSRNVRVVAVSPGPTTTPMNSASGKGKRRPDQVAQTVMAALAGSRPAVVDGRRNAVLAALIRLLPARVITGLALRMMAG